MRTTTAQLCSSCSLTAEAPEAFPAEPDIAERLTALGTLKPAAVSKFSSASCAGCRKRPGYLNVFNVA